MPSFLQVRTIVCLFVCLFGWLVGLFCLFIHPAIIDSSLTYFDKVLLLMTLLLVLLQALA
jgi:hypothetical protein